MLNDQRQGPRTRSRDKEPGLLAGRVFDPTGERLASTHACKGTRRYRYYVTQSLLGKVKGADNAAGLRVPAPELEGAVRQLLIDYLRDDHRLLADLNHPPAVVWHSVTLRAKELAGNLNGESIPDQLHAFDALIERVIVTTDQVRVRIRPSAILGERKEADTTDAKENPISLTLPVKLRRSGFGIRLIVPVLGTNAMRQVDTRLVTFVHRGMKWFRQMIGEGQGPSAIAKAEGVSASLVQRILPVVFLAPDIVKAIEAGAQPASMTADSLLKQLPLPACWEEQRRVLGMTKSEP